MRACVVASVLALACASTLTPATTKFLKIGADAACGLSVPGEIVLCLGNTTGLLLGGLKLLQVGAELRLINASTHVQRLSVSTTTGATLVGPDNGVFAGLPGTMSVAFQPCAPTQDGPWTVVGVMDMLGGIQLQQVLLAGTPYSGTRLLPPVGPYVVVGLGRTTVVIGSNAVSRATILAAIARGVPVVTQDATLHQSPGAAVVTTKAESVPADGLSRVRLVVYANGSVFGNTLARFRTEYMLEIGQCTAVTNATRVPLDAGNATHFKISECPPLADMQLGVMLYTNGTSCNTVATNTSVLLGSYDPSYTIECITAR